MLHIIITGASRGIGQAVCQYLLSLDKPIHILAISRSSIPTPSQPTNPKSTMSTFQADISKASEEIETYIKQQLKWSHIDGLLHNAGALINKPFHNTTKIELKKLLEVNTIAPYILTQQLLKLLENASSAHVVSIGSMGGFQGSSKYPGLTAYSMSKAALANFTECMASEFSDSTIRFNCLALGAIQTEMLNTAFPDYKAPTTSEQIAEYIGQFLLHQHKVMNGQIIPVRKSNP